MIINNEFLGNNAGAYTLKKPIEISVQKNVIEVLNSTYSPNSEKGGLLWLRSNGKNKAIIDKITVLQNISGMKTAFVPDEATLQRSIENIVKAGYLPLVFHTHPTQLGLSSYDTRKENFYLRASRPDRIFAKKPIDEAINLYMPECIFVKDSRFEGGYSLALYGGKILPNGFSRLSTIQFLVLGVLSYFLLSKKLTTTAFLIGGSIMILEEMKRPKYSFVDDNYIINL